MADSSLMPAVIAAAAGLIGSAIGIGGTLLVQLRVERQKQEYDKQKETRRKKAEKLEELVSTLYAHKDWVRAMIENIDKGIDSRERPPAAMPKLRAICSVYFPEFHSHIHEIAAFSAFEIFAAGGQFLPPEGATKEEGRKRLFEQGQKLTFFLENEIRDYAKREFQ